jgi:hypothetical protein
MKVCNINNSTTLLLPSEVTSEYDITVVSLDNEISDHVELSQIDIDGKLEKILISKEIVPELVKILNCFNENDRLS